MNPIRSTAAVAAQLQDTAQAELAAVAVRDLSDRAGVLRHRNMHRSLRL